MIIVREVSGMRIPRHWAKGTYSDVDQKGRKQSFWAWGWSFDSLAAAKGEATARAKRVFDRLTSGAQPDSYDYLEHPLREEIVQSLTDSDEEIAVLTRNRYGALVLNSASVCFADVDFPQIQSDGLLDAVLLFFSKKRREERARAGQEGAVQAVRQWAERNPRRSFRLYRTLAGLRLLFTDRLYDPISDEIAGLLRELGSDPLYMRMTVKQECFRARLTPKPWRCGCSRPPNRYPWDSTSAERAYRTWLGDYEKKSKAYTTCHFIETLGDGFADERINTIVGVHDRYACGEPGAKLA